ncbi:hypothetical protein AB0M28_11780 [Streptomyces sp. NPDC051940]|uniref:hypothetical protein n=1 Tax=Streptomyces sp. NPDC051940 TaxID=3155675 RepID=UPI003436A0B7
MGRGARTRVRGAGVAETAGYLAAALIIVGGGALLAKPTPILNWIVGPALTVVCVGLIGGAAERRRRRRGEAGEDAE